MTRIWTPRAWAAERLRKWKRRRVWSLAHRHRRLLHYRYIELSEMEPGLFPHGKESPRGAHVWRNDVPGCEGSITLGRLGHRFDNMCNCSCGDLAAWKTVAQAPTRTG